MATKKPTLEEQNANLEEGNALLSERVSKLGDDLETERAARRENRDIAERWKKRATELETEVGTLRDELHGMTVEKARLEGYIDRFQQTEPQPDPVMVTVPLETLQPTRMDQTSAFDAMRRYGSKDRPLPWYKRNI